MIHENVVLDARTRPYGEPVGRCIYCKTLATSDEHSLPFCLGGCTYLPTASCASCSKITSYLEGYVCRAMFGPFRARHSIQSRRKKIDLGTLPVRFETESGSEVRRIPRSELPAILAMPIWPEPGMLCNKQRTAPLTLTRVWLLARRRSLCDHGEI